MNLGLILIFVSFFLSCFLLILNLKLLHSLFKNVKKITWIALFFLFVLTIAIPSLTIPAQSINFIDEDWSMEAGKNILLLGNTYFCEYIDYNKIFCNLFPKTPGFPVFVSIFFFLFGIEKIVIYSLNTILGSLIPVLLFLLTYLLFEREDIALFSYVIYVLVPYNVVWSRSAADVIASNFFVVSSLVFFLIYLKLRDKNLLLLFLSTLYFTIYIRPENIYLLLMFVFIISNKKILKTLKTLRNKEILIISCFFLISALIVLIYFLEPMLNIYTAGGRFSLLGTRNLLYNLGIFLRFITTLPLFLITITAVYGCFNLFKERKWVFLLLTVWLVGFFLIHILSLATDERKLITLLPPITLFSSFGFYKIKKWLQNITNKKISFAFVVFMLLVLLILGILTFPAINKSPKLGYLESNIPDNLEKNIPENCYVMTDWPVTMASTTNIKVIRTELVLQNPNISESIMNSGGCLLFYEGIPCHLYVFNTSNEGFRKMHMGFKNRCNAVHERFVTKPFISYSYQGMNFTVYSIL
jgi:hypothetical protein